jgi:hypothetical protein
MGLSKAVRDVLWGNPFGSVVPKRSTQVSAVYDGRTAALRILRRYISELTFYRTAGKDLLGNVKDPIAFQVPERDIHVEWPDDEEEMRLPGIAFLAQEPANYDPIGMTSKVIEDSKDVYGQGTALIWMSEHVENFVLEIWTETKQQRRSIILGLETALSPIEQMSGIRFIMPDYYGQLVCFELQTKEIVDDDTGVILRRRAKLIVQLRYNVVALYPINELNPQTYVVVDADEQTGQPLGDPDQEMDPRPADTKKNPGPGL